MSDLKIETERLDFIRIPRLAPFSDAPLHAPSDSVRSSRVKTRKGLSIGKAVQMMESPDVSTGQGKLTRKLDASDHDQCQIPEKVGQDPDPNLKTNPVPIERDNAEITDAHYSSTRPAAHSPTATANRSKKSVRWSEDLVEERTLPPLEKGDDDYESSNPYVSRHQGPSNSSPSTINNSMVNIKDALGRWRKKVGEATKKAEDLAGNTWQHLKTAPSMTDAALGRIAQGTKVLAEGGYEKIFRHTFDTVPEEQLINSYACYLSTSAGPVMGVLYVSSAKLAFSSDNPMSYKATDKTEWSYYKVIIPLQQLKGVNQTSSRVNSSEKYIQVISVDSHEFWFMGFLNYDGAVKCIQESLQTHV